MVARTLIPRNSNKGNPELIAREDSFKSLSSTSSTVPIVNDSSKATKKAKKSVRFHKLAEIVTFEPATENCHADLYLTSEEKKANKTNAYRLARRARKTFGNGIKLLEHSYDICHDREETKNFLKTMRKWTRSEYRGLERICTDKFYENHIKSTCQLVEYYGWLAKGGVENIDELMRIRSVVLSRNSKIFASMQAYADTGEARKSR